MLDVSVKLASVILAAVLAWSAASKVLRWGDWGVLLTRYRLGRLAAATRVFVPICEAALAGALIAGVGRTAGAAVLVLIVVFSAAVLRLRALEGDRLPCGCFGRTTQRDYRITLARNALLSSLALLVTFGPHAEPLNELSMPRGADVLPAALIVSGIGAALWLGLSVARSLRGGTR